MREAEVLHGTSRTRGLARGVVGSPSSRSLTVAAMKACPRTISNSRRSLLSVMRIQSPRPRPLIQRSALDRASAEGFPEEGGHHHFLAPTALQREEPRPLIPRQQRIIVLTTEGRRG